MGRVRGLREESLWYCKNIQFKDVFPSISVSTRACHSDLTGDRAKAGFDSQGKSVLAPVKALVLFISLHIR